MHDRHLVLELNHDDRARPMATIACLADPVPWDESEHTLLASLTSCPACRAVQAARVVLIDAS